MATMPLREVDKVEILTVLDNTIDMLMASTPQVRRLPLPLMPGHARASWRRQLCCPDAT
jgi:hypothetical protein